MLTRNVLIREHLCASLLPTRRLASIVCYVNPWSVFACTIHCLRTVAAWKRVHIILCLSAFAVSQRLHIVHYTGFADIHCLGGVAAAHRLHIILCLKRVAVWLRLHLMHSVRAVDVSHRLHIINDNSLAVAPRLNIIRPTFQITNHALINSPIKKDRRTS